MGVANKIRIVEKLEDYKYNTINLKYGINNEYYINLINS